jgi:two-component system cell cycle sensor histidine kinase PleC
MTLAIQPSQGRKASDAAALMRWFSREFFAIFSKDGNCLRISENVEQVIGFQPAQCQGDAFINRIRKIDVKKFQELLNQGTLERPLRIRLRNPQGEWEWLETAHAAPQNDGSVGLIFEKITEAVQKDSALQKASFETELAMRGQSEFFAHISHELRTPLNAILGFTQMMHQGMFGELTNPRYRDYVQFLEQSGKELLHKIDDLLEISSFCAGIDQLADAQIPLEDIIKSVVDVHARELFARHMQVDINVQHVLLLGDKVKLQLVFAHLLRNAMKMSPQNSTIHITSHMDERKSLHISMTDEGNGFTQEQLDYFAIKSSELSFHDRSLKVMGFGLPLAEELMRLHGGRLICKNAAEGGACVSIILPAKRTITVSKETDSERTSKKRPSLSMD